MIEYESIYNEDPVIKIQFKRHKDLAEKHILEKYNLKNFIERIDENKIDLLLGGSPGSPMKKYNLLISIWAHLILTEGYKIDWNFMADLFNWFKKKLESHNYYKSLFQDNKDLDPETLRNQFYRNKKRSLILFEQIRKRHSEGWPFRIDSFVFFAIETSIRTRKSHMYRIFSFLEQKKDIIDLYDSIIQGKIKRSEVTYTIFLLAHLFYASKIFVENRDSSPFVIFPDLSFF